MSNCLSPIKSKQSGFTLVAVLLIISLATILVVSAMVISQIELQAGYNATRQEIARQNALFGLNQALNQIQMAAGPDRRVTARADILNTSNTATGFKGNAPANDSGQQFWTGVWRNTCNDYSGSSGNGSFGGLYTHTPSSSPAQTPGPGSSFLYYDCNPDGTSSDTTLVGKALSPSQAYPASRAQLYNNVNVTWLISWPYNQTSLISPPDPTQSITTQLGGNTFSVQTLKGGTTTLNTTVTVANGLNTNQFAAGDSSSVMVPRVPILSQAVGKTTLGAVGSYAYWVSDEGVKAKADVPDPYLGTAASTTQSSAHFQIAQSPAVSQVLSGAATFQFNAPNATDNRQKSPISPSLASMMYCDTTAPSSWADFGANPSTYSPDFTVSSYGVIADNFNGGLRKDLTAGLENYNVYQQQFSNGGYGFESSKKVYSANSITGSAVSLDDGGKTVTSLSTGTAFVLDGLRWDSLFYYYNSYHAIMQSPIMGATAATSFGGVGQTAYTQELSNGSLPTLTARTYREVDPVYNSNLNMDGIMPLPVYYQIDFNIWLNPQTTPNYDLMVGGNAGVVEYNPFDVNLQKPTSAYEMLYCDDGNAGGNGNFATTQTLQITDNSTSPATSIMNASLNLTYQANVEVGPDTTAFYPGELRLYGLAKSNQVQPISVTNETYSPTDICEPGTSTSPAFFAFQNSFANPSSSTYNLQSLTACAFTDQTYQYEEIKPRSGPALQIPNPGSTEVYFGGGNGMNTYQPIMYDFGYGGPTGLWPKAGSGASALGFVSPGYIGGSGVKALVDLGSVTHLTFSTNSLLTIPPLVKYIDRVPGTNCTTFVPHDQAPSKIVSMSLPGFAAGGALLNPLDTDINGLLRDHAGAFVYYTGCTDSNNNVSSTNNPVPGGGTVTDTSWLPDSVGSMDNPTQSNQPVIYSIPRQPLLSIGQFKNMYCHYSALGPSRYGVIRDQELGFSVYTVGGSYQAGLPSNETYESPTTMNSKQNFTPLSGYAVLLDDNFLANEVLFDSYFLSTVPPPAVVTGTDSKCWPITVAKFGQSYVDTNQALPNSRLVYYRRPQNSSAPFHGNPPASGTSSPNYEDLQCAPLGSDATNPASSSAALAINLRKSAANLLINGAFNVNSTSVPAWTALLDSNSSGSAANILQYYFGSLSGSTPTSYTFPSTENPFLNFPHPFGTVSWSTTADSNTPLFGVVNLKTSTIETLAQNIVNQVKMRGPFLSLGDFINRRLTPATTPLSYSGALQAAIDATDASKGINSNVEKQPLPGEPAAPGSPNGPQIGAALSSAATFSLVQNANMLPYVNTVPASGNSAAGVPGTLMQGDLLQAIAPAIASRSDTFTIRFYGQALSPTGSSEAEAYGEAVVQRLPEYLYSMENHTLDSTGKANYAYDDPNMNPVVTNSSSINGLTNSNYALGRRFKIISFRWLNKNEL